MGANTCTSCIGVSLSGKSELPEYQEAEELGKPWASSSMERPTPPAASNPASKLRTFMAWSATVVLVLCVFSGLLVGVAFAIHSAYDNDCKVNLPESLYNSPATTVSPRVAAARAMKAALTHAAANFSSAAVSVTAHLTTEALHDASAWEAYVMYRTRFGAAEALGYKAYQDALRGLRENVMVMDKNMLEENDVVAASGRLVNIMAAAKALVNDVTEKPFGLRVSASDETASAKPVVLAALDSLSDYAGALVTRGGVAVDAPAGMVLVEETTLMDVHTAVLSMDVAVSAVAPALLEAGQDVALAAGTAATLEAMQELAKYASDATDFWLTKVAKPETCAEEVVKHITECEAKRARLVAGDGCTPGIGCTQAIQALTAECTMEQQQKELKCTSRLAFVRACGTDYETALRNCSASVVAAGGVGDEQWACKAAADKARIKCIQVQELNRKCNEERDKAITQCSNPTAASCIAGGEKKRTECIKKEAAKRIDCKFFKRDEHIGKCIDSDQTRLQMCTALVWGSRQQYETCMASADTAAGTCKFNIEREVKKCEEESPCKRAEDSAKAVCQANFGTAVSACVSGNSTCAEAAATAQNICEEQAKSASKACKDGPALDAINEWVSEQQTKGEIVASVTRYRHYLPVSLLTPKQRSDINARLARLAGALSAVRDAWAAMV